MISPPCLPSVVVRTAGRDLRFLQRALASVRAQSVAPLEVVIFNAGGDSAQIDRVVLASGLEDTVVRHEGPVPQAAAANRGVALSRGGWVTFLDDDDTWDRGFIGRMTEVVRRREGMASFGGVVARTWSVQEEIAGNEVREIRRELLNGELKTIDLAALALENRFTNNALVFRRTAFEAVGRFREDLPALYDWEFNVRLALKFDLEVLPEPLAYYHLRSPSDAAPNTPAADFERASTQIRNEWLRADITAGRLGLGQLSLAGETVGLARTLTRFERWRTRVRRWFGGGK